MLWPFVVLINPQFGKHWLSAGAISFPGSLLPLQHNEFKELKATLPVRMMKFHCIPGGPWCPQNQTSLREDVAGGWLGCWKSARKGGPVACTVQCGLSGLCFRQA